MTATATSSEAYSKEESAGRLRVLRAKVLAALKVHGPCTARELSAASGLDPTVQKRLPELVDSGAAIRAGERPCKETGRVATVWAIKDLSAAKNPPPRRLASVTSTEVFSEPTSTLSRRYTTSSRKPGAIIVGTVRVMAPGSVRIEMKSSCPCGTINPCASELHCAAPGHVRCGCGART